MLKYVCEFNVSGTGDFPIDMLRYDRCSPYSSQDAGKIGSGGLADYCDTRTVKLIRFTQGKGKNYKDNPTNDRWKSFGWAVSNVEFRKL